MKEKSSSMEQAKFSRRILRNRRKILRSPMPNEHPGQGHNDKHFWFWLKHFLLPLKLRSYLQGLGYPRQPFLPRQLYQVFT